MPCRLRMQPLLYAPVVNAGIGREAGTCSRQEDRGTPVNRLGGGCCCLPTCDAGPGPNKNAGVAAGFGALIEADAAAPVPNLMGAKAGALLLLGGRPLSGTAAGAAWAGAVAAAVPHSGGGTPAGLVWKLS